MAACAKFDVKTHDRAPDLPFRGITSLGTDERGNLVVSWDPVTAAQAIGEITYRVYMAEIPEATVGLALDDGPRFIQLPENAQPKKAGALVKSLSFNRFVTTYALEDGHFYAFQVTALAGDRRGDNQAVMVTRYKAQDIALEAVGGNYQLGAPGQALPVPLKARLTNAKKPLPGELVTFAIQGGGGMLSSAAVATDANGEVAVTYTPGDQPGTFAVKAAWREGLREATFVAITRGGAMGEDSGTSLTPQLAIAGGRVQAGPVASDFASPLKVRLTRGATALAGETVTFTVSAKPGGAAGTNLSAASAVTDAAGEAAVIFHAGDKAGTYEVTASWQGKSEAFAMIASGTSDAKILKIVAAGAGAQAAVTTATLNLGTDTLAVKAALYDLTGTLYIADAAVAWTLAGGGFGGADLQGTPANAVSVTFSPTHAGSTLLQATYLGADASVVGTTASTGFLTVTSTLTPQVLVIDAGDGQSAVAGSNLSMPLRVKVTTSGGVPVPGEAITFTATQGGGTLVTPQPVVTDANGLASAVAQVGTVAMANIFRAQSASAPALTRDFQATATPGAATKLVFSTQPALAFRNFRFLTQPIVTVRDAYGNLVTTATHGVTLAKASGAGSPIGGMTVAAVNGIATFVDVGWDTQEAGVTLQATAVPALTPVVSAPVTVNGPLASACTSESMAFKTADGGCQDQSTGYVWSAVHAGVTWHNAIWDVGVSGASPMRDSDWYRTNEYVETSATPCGGPTCDASPAALCHDLTTAGYTDWRLPSIAELQTARINGLLSHQSAIVGTDLFWSRDVWYLPNEAKHFRFSDGYTATDFMTVPLSVMCLRGGPTRAYPSHVEWVAKPTSVVSGSLFTLKVALLTPSNGQVNYEGSPMTVALLTGSGTLSGTLTRNTNKAGIATFDDLTYDGIGETITIQAQSAHGYVAPPPASIFFTSLPGGCHQADDANFRTQEGGCKDLSTGLVWSAPSASGMTWDAAFWDANVPGAGPIEPSDHGWSNDYPANGIACEKGPATCDLDPLAYCHDMTSNGYSDWRLATMSEMQTARGNGLATRFDFSNDYYWAPTRQTSSDGAWFRFSDGSNGFVTRSYIQKAVCVRGGAPRPDPARVEFVPPRVRATVGVVANGIVARIVDAGGNPVNRAGVQVALAKSGGAGTLSGTLTKASDSAGMVTFDDVTYDAAESVSLTLANNASFANGTPLPFNVTAVPGGCLVEDGTYATAGGGCRSSATGLVWSSATAGSFNRDGGIAYCGALLEGGQSDWRLPSLAEFSTITGEGNVHLEVRNSYLFRTVEDIVKLESGMGYGLPPSDYANVICVRP